jgi:hypothetical protein
MLQRFLGCFDVLIAHPSIRPGETLTGFVRYLCATNKITSTDEASLLFFPLQSRRIIKFMKDYPPLDLSHLSPIAKLTEADLRAATFYEIGRKFGRPTHPQALSRFLGNKVSPYLRICPPCMASNPYHRLIWRFVDVIGCLEHNCYLVDACHGCKRKLPLFRAPFDLGRCSYCRTDLAQTKTAPMNVEDRRQTATALEDIEFLLAPADWEANVDAVIKSVGLYFVKQRESLKKSRQEFANILGFSESMLTGIELARFSSYGATFSAYSTYARLIGTTLKAAFLSGMALAPLESPARLTGQALIDKVQVVIVELLQDNTPITGKDTFRNNSAEF